MALVKCPECGREVSERAKNCPACGYPISESKTDKPVQNKGEFQTARLIISIIMLVFSVFVLFQSCAVGVANSLEDNGQADGGIGTLVSMSMIVLGVAGIATRKTINHLTIRALGTISALIGLYCSQVYDGIFKDLKVWGWLLMINGVLFLFASNTIKKNRSSI